MSVIDEIKERVDIIDLVSQYVPNLKKAGQNYRALCPFHTEKTPSFFVFPDRQSWHCFGSCSTGGDIFAFVMKKEGVDFSEALRILAQRAGIALVTVKQDDAGDKERNELYSINKIAADYYHQYLLTSHAADPVRKYLERRGVSQKSIEDFQLGFSPNSWDTMKNLFTSQGTLRQGLSTGLLVEKDGGGCYDRFRGHLMFPIYNVRENIVGFGARVLDDSLPKYLNSPQSLIFDKSSELYGIHLAHSSINKLKQAVIVEGYMDVIIAHQYGFNNVVASMSTALTSKQALALKKLTQNFVLAMDADKAGNSAPQRDLENFLLTMDSIKNFISVSDGKRSVGGSYSTEYFVRVMSLPAGRDPDEVIIESKETWQRLVNDAPHWADFIIDITTSEIDSNDVRSKSTAVNKILPFLSAIPDPIERAHYRQKLARVAGVNEDDLISAMDKLMGGISGKPVRSRTVKHVSKPFSGNPREDYCLTLLLRYPELGKKELKILPDYFTHTENRELFLLWQNSSEKKSLAVNLETPIKEQYDYLINKYIPPMSDKELEIAFNDSVRCLHEQYLRDLKLKESLLYSDPDTSDNISDMEIVERKGLAHNNQLRDLFNNTHKQ